MPTYGQRPDDVVADSRGNALKGVLLKLYTTEALAKAGGTPLGTAVSGDDGTWEFVTDELDLYARLPNGKVWQIAQSVEALVSAAQSAATDATAAKDLAQDALNSAQAAATAADASASTAQKRTRPSVVLKGAGIDPTGVSDSTTAIRTLFDTELAAGAKHFVGEQGATYKVAIADSAWLFKLAGTTGVTIDLSGCTLDNSSVSYTADTITPVFLLDGAKDTTVLVGQYLGFTLPTPASHLGYRGATLVHVINGADGVRVDARITNARYGLVTGNYATPSQGGCKNFDVKLRTSFVGYPVAAYLAEGMRLEVDADDIHRAVYVAGCNDVTGVVRWRNNYIAPYPVIITDALTSGTDAAAQADPVGAATTSRGSSNVDLTVIDKGSTTFQANTYCAAISLSRVDPVTFRNISLRTYTVGTATTSTTVHGVAITSTANSIWSRYTFNWEPTVVLENITIAGTDDKSGSNVSAGASGSLNIVADAGSSTHGATVRGLKIEGYTIAAPSSGGYVGSTITARGVATPVVLRRFSTPGAWLALTLSTTVPTVLEECTLLTLDLAGLGGQAVVKKYGTTVSATNPVTSDLIHDGGTIRGTGPRMRSKQIDATLTGASVTLTGAIPAGAKVEAVQGRVTTAITGATGFQVGVSGDLTRYGDRAVTGTGNLLQPEHHAASAITSAIYPTATDLIVTAKTSNFTAGVLRLVVTYWEYPLLAN